jgi:hypothetical protein
MHRAGRLHDTARVLFDARQPVAAEQIAGRIGVRVAGVRHCLRLLHRRGQAERLVGERGDGQVVRLWRSVSSARVRYSGRVAPPVPLCRRPLRCVLRCNPIQGLQHNATTTERRRQRVAPRCTTACNVAT